jgi:predicted transcriptional regulator
MFGRKVWKWMTICGGSLLEAEERRDSVSAVEQGLADVESGRVLTLFPVPGNS